MTCFTLKSMLGSVLLITMVSTTSLAQDLKKFNLYKPTENADSALSIVLHQAELAGKNVFVQIGGNWCIWCARFHELVTSDQQLDSAIRSNYIVYHLNYSKENKNADLLKRFGYPQRFGFPVFIILDAKGNRLHTQNSSYLEEGKGYNKENILGFINDWGPRALAPEQYKDY